MFNLEIMLGGLLRIVLFVCPSRRSVSLSLTVYPLLFITSSSLVFPLSLFSSNTKQNTRLQRTAPSSSQITDRTLIDELVPSFLHSPLHSSLLSHTCSKTLFGLDPTILPRL